MNTELSEHLFIEQLDEATRNVTLAVTHWKSLRQEGMVRRDDVASAIRRLKVAISALRMDAIGTKQEDGPATAPK